MEFFHQVRKGSRKRLSNEKGLDQGLPLVGQGKWFKGEGMGLEGEG